MSHLSTELYIGYYILITSLSHTNITILAIIIFFTEYFKFGIEISFGNYRYQPPYSLSYTTSRGPSAKVLPYVWLASLDEP